MLARKLQIAAGGAESSILDTDYAELLAFYDMGDTTSGSSLIDISPNAKNGTMVNTTTGTGKFGVGLVGDGSTSYVALPVLDYAQEMTITGWVKRSSSQEMALFSTYSYQNNNRGIELQINSSGRLQGRASNNGTTVTILTASNSINTNALVFVALVVSLTQIKIHYQRSEGGVLQTETLAFTGPIYNHGIQPMLLARDKFNDGSANESFLDGLFDHCRVIGIASSDDDINTFLTESA